MKSFNELLDESVLRHGHLCGGQVIGVRMAMLGCRLLGIDEPKAPDQRKKLMVFVEIDRCATDAIESVTGCCMGRRTLKFKDFGINAATFLHLETQKAYRIVSTETSRDLCKEFAPGQIDLKNQQIEGYRNMPDHLLFDVQNVRVELKAWELPGPTKHRAACQRCGQLVRDAREINRGNEVLCRPCAGEGYFSLLETVTQY